MLRFRNVVGSPDDPVESWGFEGLLAAIDRGELSDWRRIIAAIRNEPDGELTDVLAEALAAAEDSGVAGALTAAVESVRERQRERDRAAVASDLRDLVARSGLDQGTFARRIGTSRTRLNAYLSGRTMPSALVVLRARRVSERQRSA